MYAFQTNRQWNRQSDKQINRQTHRQTDKQTDGYHHRINPCVCERGFDRMQGAANLSPRPIAWCCHLVNLTALSVLFLGERYSLAVCLSVCLHVSSVTFVCPTQAFFNRIVNIWNNLSLDTTDFCFQRFRKSLCSDYLTQSCKVNFTWLLLSWYCRNSFHLILFYYQHVSGYLVFCCIK